jgi:hypothetical protein
MRPHTTGAGLLTEHHQGVLQAPARVSGANHDVLTAGAPSRATWRQCELPLYPTSPNHSPARSRAARLEALMRALFNDEPSIRALLEATAAAEERRRRKASTGRAHLRPAASATPFAREGPWRESGR